MFKFLGKFLQAEETNIHIKYVFRGVNLVDANGNKQFKEYTSTAEQNCSSKEMIKLVFDEIAQDIEVATKVALNNRPPINMEILPDISISMTGTLSGRKNLMSFTNLNSFRDHLTRETILPMNRQNGPK